MNPNPSTLILLSHGSKRASWSAPFEEIRKSLLSLPNHPFPGGIELAFLEGRGPLLKEVVEEQMDKGVQAFEVIPLFLTASTHLREDVPNEIERVRNCFASTPMTLHLASHRPLSDSIWEETRRRALDRGTRPSHTAIVLVYYGSERFASEWTALLQRAEEVLLAAGFSSCLNAPVGHVVHGSPKPTQLAIEKGLEEAESVVVLPMLLSPGIFQHEVIPKAVEAISAEQRHRVFYEPDSILPDPNVLKWIQSLYESAGDSSP